MAVVRRLPNTDAGRALALDRAAIKLSITAPADIVLTAQSQTRLAAIRPTFNTNLVLRGQALGNQTVATPGKDSARRVAALFISHYVQGCDKAAMRGETGFFKADRSYFQLDGTNFDIPDLENDNEVLLWGPRIIDGDALRIAAGKPVMPFPAIADVTAKYNLFSTAFGDYSLLKTAYDNAQEAISNMREDVDSLILRMWNETEAAYSEEAPSSKRRNARDWGVVYVLVAGTVPTPDDFSIMGKVTIAVPGSPVPVADVTVTVLETGDTVLSQSNGDYLVSRLNPGTYTLQVEKAGFVTQTITNVTVVDGQITTLNISLLPAAATGSLVGSVTLGGSPVSASITIEGTTFSASTEPTTGVYTIENIPAGNITVRATIIADPANFQTQNITIVAGQANELLFVFP